MPCPTKCGVTFDLRSMPLQLNPKFALSCWQVVARAFVLVSIWVIWATSRRRVTIGGQARRRALLRISDRWK